MKISFANSQKAESLTAILKNFWPEAHDAFTPAPTQQGGSDEGKSQVGIIAWNLQKSFGQETLTIHADEPTITIESNGTATATFKNMALAYTNQSQTIKIAVTLHDLVSAGFIAKLQAEIAQQLAPA